MRWRELASACAVVAMLGTAAIGCGGSSTGTSAPPATSAPATSPPTTQDKVADEKLAKAALLEVDDLPDDTWTVDKSDRGRDGYGSVIDGCSDATDEMIKTFGAADKAPSETSPQFIGTEGALSNEVTVFADEDQARTLGEALLADPMVACLKARILSQLRQAGYKPDASLIKVTLDEDAETFADQQVIFRTMITVDPSQVDPTAPTEEVDHALVVFTRVGRGWTNVDFRTVGARVDIDDVAPIVKTAVKKLKSELAGA